MEHIGRSRRETERQRKFKALSVLTVLSRQKDQINCSHFPSCASFENFGSLNRILYVLKVYFRLTPISLLATIKKRHIIIEFPIDRRYIFIPSVRTKPEYLDNSIQTRKVANYKPQLLKLLRNPESRRPHISSSNQKASSRQLLDILQHLYTGCNAPCQQWNLILRKVKPFLTNQHFSHAVRQRLASQENSPSRIRITDSGLWVRRDRRKAQLDLQEMT